MAKYGTPPFFHLKFFLPKLLRMKWILNTTLKIVTFFFFLMKASLNSLIEHRVRHAHSLNSRIFNIIILTLPAGVLWSSRVSKYTYNNMLDVLITGETAQVGLILNTLYITRTTTSLSRCLLLVLTGGI